MADFKIPEPAANRKTLMFIAGGLWATAGIVLLARAVPWLIAARAAGAAAGALGVLAGILKGRLVFVPLAMRNVVRINALSPHKEKICLFAFQAAWSYILIAFMITLGILLRLSPLSRTVIGGVYVAIGSALLIASASYLRSGWNYPWFRVRSKASKNGQAIVP